MSNLLSGNFPYLPYRNINVGNTGAVVKAAKSQIFSIYMSNTGGAVAYVKLYDKATAATASDTPTHTLAVQASQSVAWSPTDGINFINGISVRATTEVADAGTTSPGANEVIVNIQYLS